MDFLLALLSTVIVTVPWLFSRRRVLGLILGAATLVINWIIFYLSVPNLAAAEGGLVGAMILAELIIFAIVYFIINVDSGDSDRVPLPPILAGVVIIIMLIRGCAGSEMVNSTDYANLIGEMPTKVWTQDVQPKDPKHIRLVPKELAQWLADKQLGQAGNIGSQFSLNYDAMTLQVVNGELWYVAPFEFRDFWVWNSVGAAPGYVMVSAEDPARTVVVKTNEKFAYTPGAWFGHNLDRHLRNNGYLTRQAADYTFEIDDHGKAWWTATVSRPSIVWFGDKVDGIALVDPTDGHIDFHPIGQVPSWVDRVVPQSLIKDYVASWGDLRGGYWHCVFGNKDGCLKPGSAPLLVYGSDSDPYWVTDLTSQNAADNSMVGLIYTDARTGKSTRYETRGGTPGAILDTVNAKVQFKKWHGADPVIYNLYGTMVAIVPVLAENHSLQGVAIVRIDNQQVALGDDAQSALREFQRMEAQTGEQIAADNAHGRVKVTGVVDRVGSEVREKETIYYLHLRGVNRLFNGGGQVSAKLPLTQVGDQVTIECANTDEDVEAILTFDNQSLTLDKSPLQDAVEKNEAKNRVEAEHANEAQTLRERVKGMTDDDLRKLFEHGGPPDAGH